MNIAERQDWRKALLGKIEHLTEDDKIYKYLVFSLVGLFFIGCVLLIYLGIQRPDVRISM